MQAVIGALRANLGLNSAQFERGARRVDRRLQTMRRQFLAVAGTVAALGVTLTRVALRGAADIDRVVKAARRVDGSAGAFQALELAAGELGVSLSALTNDVQTMNRELARNSAGAQRAMAQLGLSAQDLLAMDADDRVAAIADRVRDLGLSAGEATVLLSDLGIRNREMALLFLQGGDAIRAARQDIRDYGLEIDDAMGRRVEQARDNISRLSIVTQLFGQRLAAEVVPALGDFAQILTDSMREGGLLRRSVEALARNMQLLVSIAASAVLVMGTRFVGALIAVRVAAITATGALAAMKTALIRTGVGALVVGAGFLLDLMVRLRVATGNWGEAAALAVDVVREAFGRVTFSIAVWENLLVAAAQTLSAAMAGVSATIFETVESAVRALTRGTVAMVNVAIEALETMTNRARQAVNTLISGLNEVPGVNISLLGDVALGRATASDEDGLFGRAAAAVRRRQAEAQEAADNAVRIAGVMRGMAQMPLESVARLREVLSGTADATGDAADEARRLAEELRAIQDAAGGGGGGGGGGQGLIPTLEEARSQIEQLGQTIQSSMEQGFMSIVDGTKSARDAFRDMARQILSELFRVLVVQRLVGAFGGGGILGAIGGVFGIGANANGTTNWRGGLTMVGERGPELVNLPRGSQVIDAQRTASRMDGGDVIQHFNFNLAANGDESVRRIVAQAAPQIVEAAKSGVLDARRRGGSYRAAFG